MGMFDKDKEIGVLLVRYFQEREEFIVWNAWIARDDYPTNLGPTAQVKMEVSRIADPGNRLEVSTLASAIAAKVREADPADFPAVVFWTTAPSRYPGQSDATVLQFVRQYTNRIERNHDSTPAPVPAPVREQVERVAPPPQQ